MGVSGRSDGPGAVQREVLRLPLLGGLQLRPVRPLVRLGSLGAPQGLEDLYIDKETYEPLYSFAYDRKKELWKIIWHHHRYSEDWTGDSPETTDPATKGAPWYEPWEGVAAPNDIRVIADIIVNVQTGTGNRIEFWNNHGTPLKSKGKIRRYIDIGRLNKGR
jgi:hypothetical protein